MASFLVSASFLSECSFTNPKAILEDNFLCNTCQLDAEPDQPDNINKQSLHTYTHPLVRCKEYVEDPPLPEDPTMSELRSDLEKMICERVGELREHSNRLEGRIDQLQERLQGMERMLGNLLAQRVGGSSESQK